MLLVTSIPGDFTNLVCVIVSYSFALHRRRLTLFPFFMFSKLTAEFTIEGLGDISGCLPLVASFLTKLFELAGSFLNETYSISPQAMLVQARSAGRMFWNERSAFGSLPQSAVLPNGQWARRPTSPRTLKSHTAPGALRRSFNSSKLADRTPQISCIWRGGLARAISQVERHGGILQRVAPPCAPSKGTLRRDVPPSCVQDSER